MRKKCPVCKAKRRIMEKFITYCKYICHRLYIGHYCSKCPPFAFTQAWSLGLQFSIAVRMRYHGKAVPFTKKSLLQILLTGVGFTADLLLQLRSDEINPTP